VAVSAAAACLPPSRSRRKEADVSTTFTGWLASRGANRHATFFGAQASSEVPGLCAARCICSRTNALTRAIPTIPATTDPSIALVRRPSSCSRGQSIQFRIRMVLLRPDFGPNAACFREIITRFNRYDSIKIESRSVERVLFRCPQP